jgi:hypothetical protein
MYSEQQASSRMLEMVQNLSRVVTELINRIERLENAVYRRNELLVAPLPQVTYNFNIPPFRVGKKNYVLIYYAGIYEFSSLSRARKQCWFAIPWV